MLFGQDARGLFHRRSFDVELAKLEPIIKYISNKITGDCCNTTLHSSVSSVNSSNRLVGYIVIILLLSLLLLLLCAYLVIMQWGFLIFSSL